MSYFEAVEHAYLAARGRAALLTPKDYRVIQGWQSSGVPVDLACRVTTEVVTAARQRGDRVHSLGYVDRAVRKEFAAVRELQAAAHRPAADRPPQAAEAHPAPGARYQPTLDALRALNAEPPITEAIDALETVLGESASLAELLPAVRVIEAEMVEGLESSLTEAERAEMELAVSRRVRQQLHHLPVEEITDHLPRLRKGEIRRRFNLPEFP